MRIVDTFPFSEPYEADVLLIKFVLESECVCEWVIVENSYTFQGDFKGLHAAKLINEDPRFEPYRGRITVISTDVPPTTRVEGRALSEEEAFAAEYRQRELSREYILAKYTEEDFVIPSDTDESLDFSDQRRRKKILERLGKTSRIANFCRVRYAYDFDNRWSELRASQAVRLSYLRESNLSFAEIRKRYQFGIPFAREPLAFEYSYCFTREGILRKYASYAHTGFDVAAIARGLECNHSPFRSEADFSLRRQHWLEFVRLTERNSPKYVRDNLQFLRTGAISPNYRQNRAMLYPQHFSERLLSKARVRGQFRRVRESFSRLRHEMSQYLHRRGTIGL